VGCDHLSSPWFIRADARPAQQVNPVILVGHGSKEGRHTRKDGLNLGTDRQVIEQPASPACVQDMVIAARVPIALCEAVDQGPRLVRGATDARLYQGPHALLGLGDLGEHRLDDR
jgi:hypothetical protein